MDITLLNKKIFLITNKCLECNNNDTCFCINFDSEKEYYCLGCLIEKFKMFNDSDDKHKCVSCRKDYKCMRLQDTNFYLCLTCIFVIFDNNEIKLE